MTHADVLRSLDAPTRAALTARHPVRGLAHLGGHLGALALCSAVILSGVPGWWLALVPQGVLLVFLFTLQHECTHRTPFASDRLCDLAGHAIGALILNPFLWFRAFHLAHHRHTNQPGDPELDHPKPATRLAWAWHVSGLPLWWGSLALLIRLARGREAPSFLGARQLPRAQAEARVILALVALALASLAVSDAVLWLWIVPALLGQPFLRVYLLAEHGDCPQVADMLQNTRTTLTTRALRALAWNMPFHIEHHTCPTVPFHNLPALHDRMRAHLGMTAPGYGAFTRDYLARRPLR